MAKPPSVDYTSGIYFPQLAEEFKISKDPLFDYYSTNSGMYPKNPGGGGGGGGGSEAEIQALKRRMSAQETEMDGVQTDLNGLHSEQGQQNSAISSLNQTRKDQADAAIIAATDLSSIKTSADIDEIEDIIGNQMILSAAQLTILNAMN